jgi:cardiolipin synthase
VNIPNLLTFVRIAMTPWIVMRLLAGDCHAALTLLAIAAATDGIDGYIARRYKQMTRLGGWLDPIADKLLLTAVYISLGIIAVVPAWLVWLIVGRDLVILAMAAAGVFFTSHRNFPPSIWGKLSTGVQIATALTGVLACTVDFAVPGIFIWTTAAITAWSGVHYIWRGWHMLRGAGA